MVKKILFSLLMVSCFCTISCMHKKVEIKMTDRNNIDEMRLEFDRFLDEAKRIQSNEFNK